MARVAGVGRLVALQCYAETMTMAIRINVIYTCSQTLQPLVRLSTFNFSYSIAVINAAGLIRSEKLELIHFWCVLTVLLNIEFYHEIY